MISRVVEIVDGILPVSTLVVAINRPHGLRRN